MIDIREADINDYKTIAYIINEAYKVAYKDIIPQEDMLLYSGTARRENLIKEYFKEGKLKYYIAKLYGKDCGIVSFKPYEGDKYKDCAFIMQLDVLPQFHRKGIGKALMAHITEIAKSEGYKMFFLIALEENKKACLFYEKLGFEYCGAEDSPDFSKRVVRALYRKDLI